MLFYLNGGYISINMNEVDIDMLCNISLDVKITIKEYIVINILICKL